MATTAESFERLQAALEASSASHWWPVLSQWLENGRSWHSFHTDDRTTDPAVAEVIELVESGQTESDSAFALALAGLEFARRRATMRPGIQWSPLDGAFADFVALAPAGATRTYYDARTPPLHLAYVLLGWALWECER